MSEIEELRARVDVLEQETAAYSALFGALGRLLGPQFLETAADITQLTGAHPAARGLVSKRMTEALRIIDDLRLIAETKP
ncbi:hypothetical protein [Methylobacterium nodulans]|uniref:Uncharacterized protein n=1 Tax=Methylobacterium nodulans (strain LMG 21967 / CNCM I-2342 / ORS 2060) TaxID=460265 RepID=B8IQF8_METNO|nr:hypothetical protein [Methylobacterium nodulans]ACL60470.1 hypothetical protein Mnod_5629 [Methylobacterium nodulans ORS 2060]